MSYDQIQRIGFKNNDFIKQTAQQYMQNSLSYPTVDINEPIYDKLDIKRNNPTDKSNDGKFSASEALKNFGKGFISPITAMFSSMKNFCIGAGMIAAGAGLIWAAGAAAAIPLLVVGLGFGAITTGVGVYKFATAKDGDDKEKAMHYFGQAAFEILGSILPAKASLRGALISETANGAKVVKSTEIAKAIGIAADKADDIAVVEAAVNNMRFDEAIIANIKAFKSASNVSWKNFSGRFSGKPLETSVDPEILTKKREAGKAIKEYNAKSVIDEKVKNHTTSKYPDLARKSLLGDTEMELSSVNNELNRIKSYEQTHGLKLKKLELLEHRGKLIKDKNYLSKRVIEDYNAKKAKVQADTAKKLKENPLQDLTNEELAVETEKIIPDLDNMRGHLQQREAELAKLMEDPKRNAVKIAETELRIAEIQEIEQPLAQQVKYIDKRLSSLDDTPALKQTQAEFVGKTQLINSKTGEPVEIQVTKSVNKFGNETYKLSDSEGNPIGYTKLKILSNKESFEKEGMIFESANSYGQTGNEQYAGRVCVDLMENNSSYKDVGSKLHQIAIERSIQKGFKGRVQLDAAWNSHGFHYKKGFRAVGGEKSDSINQQISQILSDAKAKGIKPNTKDLGSVQMFLPYDQITIWQQAISRNPILV